MSEYSVGLRVSIGRMKKEFTAEAQRRRENLKNGRSDSASAWSFPGFESAEVAEAAERSLAGPEFQKFTAETQRRGEDLKNGCSDGANASSSPGFESAEVAEAAERISFWLLAFSCWLCGKLGGWGRRFRLPFVFATAILAAGCGYHLGGQGDLVPKDVKTIAIPEFSNGTMQYHVATLLTADVVREFHARTHYTIVTDPGKADAVLMGSVVRVDTLGGITTDPVTGRATSSQIILIMQFTLTDRHTGKVIYQRNGYEFRTRYEISLSLPNYFDESSPAMKRVSQDAAKAVVTSILEAF
jgi:outer membrane lipopolysaccharide assembly protein LptE/RlpB